MFIDNGFKKLNSFVSCVSGIYGGERSERDIKRESYKVLVDFTILHR